MLDIGNKKSGEIRDDKRRNFKYFYYFTGIIRSGTVGRDSNWVNLQPQFADRSEPFTFC